MAPSNFGYSIKEAVRHFFRNWTTSFGAVITIFLSLFIIGLFIIGSVLVNSAIGNVEDQVTIQAYISDNASDEDVEDYQDELERMDNVKNVEFVSKEDALEEYSSTISGNADATLSALDGQNPLPRSFRIEMEDPSQVEAMAEKIKDDSGFRKIVDDADPEVDDKDADVAENVRYGKEEVGRLFQLTGYIRVACSPSWRSSSSTTPSACPSPPVVARSPSCVSSAPPTASSAGPLSPRVCCRPCSAPCSPSACLSCSATSSSPRLLRASVG